VLSVLNKINLALNRLIPVTTPLAVAMGLFLPFIFIRLRPLVILLFGIMTFSGALKLTARELGNTIKSPVPIILFFITSHIIMPLAAFASSSLIIPVQDIITGFVLLFAGPTAVSGFIWVAIFKGDKALSLTFILLDTILAPVVVPATLSFILGESISMDMSGIAVSLIFMVVVPTIIAVSLNEISKRKIPDKICPFIEPFAKICLILVIAANSSAAAKDIHFSDPVFWITAALCIVLTVIGFLFAKLNGVIERCTVKTSGTVNDSRGSEKGISLIIAGGLRNNSAVMTIAVTFFPEATVLPTLLSIVFQQIITAIMGKVLIKKN